MKKMGKEQYISRRDLICWLLKEGTEKGRLNVERTLTLGEIMKGINGLPAIKMAEKEKLLELGIWQMVSPKDRAEEELKMFTEMHKIFESCNKNSTFWKMTIPGRKEQESRERHADRLLFIWNGDIFEVLPIMDF